ncbi:MAG: hypothetical protein EP343_07800 [Deltaproteobacteria bacterium]|nr:MAG: hypothetical protein EP343_07800 [Deltaproteobacteria bacterium]
MSDVEKFINLPGKPVDLTVWHDGLALATETEVTGVSLPEREECTYPIAKAEHMWSLTSTPSGNHLYGVGEKNLYVWDRETCEIVWQTSNENYISHLAIDASEELLLASNDTTVFVLKAADGKTHKKVALHGYSDEAATKAAWLPGHERFAVTHVNKLSWYSQAAADKKRLGQVGFRYYSAFWDVAASPDGVHVAGLIDPCGGGEGYKVNVWNLETETMTLRLRWKDCADFSPTAIAYTPDGSQLLVAGDPKEKSWLTFWDTSTRKRIKRTLPFGTKLGPEICRMQVHPEGESLFGLCLAMSKGAASSTLWHWDLA